MGSYPSDASGLDDRVRARGRGGRQIAGPRRSPRFLARMKRWSWLGRLQAGGIGCLMRRRAATPVIRAVRERTFLNGAQVDVAIRRLSATATIPTRTDSPTC